MLASLRVYWLETKYEFLSGWRLPLFSVSTIAYPLMFYLIFGISNTNESIANLGATTYLLITYGVFGIIGAAMFNFGVGVASERGQGWMQLKRVSPMPPMARFLSKIFVSMFYGLLIVFGLLVIGYSLGGVRLALVDILSLTSILVLGMFPFCALGLMIAYLSGPNSAPAVVNLIYLPMAFASGLWIPVQFLPEFVQRLAPFLPPYHFAQLALYDFGAGSGQVWQHILWLVGFTFVFLTIAVILYKRDEGKTYG